MDFWANHFSSKGTEKESSAADSKPSSDQKMKPVVSNFQVRTCPQPVPFQNRHPFLKRELLQPKARKSQDLLADFRARGATVRRPIVEAGPHGLTVKKEEKNQTSAPATKDTERIRGHDEQFIRLFLGSQLQPAEEDSDSKVTSRIKFPVLYSNYSTHDKFESSFCVYPSSIVMELSGSNCLTLRSFLDNYCFRPDYKCPNNECKSSQLTDHIRKFGYSNGSVCLTLKQIEQDKSGEQQEPPSTTESEPKNSEPSIMSSTFCDICKFTTEYAPLSDEFMSMSFAKFLMLRICGQEYIKRKPSQEPVSECKHESFLRHSQFFKNKNLMAAFEYQPINFRNIFLPQIDIKVKISLKSLRDETCEELKKVSVRGWESHGAVHDKVTNLRDELQGMVVGQAVVDGRTAQVMQLIHEYIPQEEKDRSEFRRSVEQIQVDLCSKNQDIESTYQVMNSLFFLKKQIVNFVESWNVKIAELNKRRNFKGSHASTASLARPDSSKQVPTLAQTAIPESVSRKETDSMETSTEDVFNKSDCSTKSEVDAVFRDSAEEMIDKLSLTASERSDESTNINPILGDDASSDGGVTDDSYAIYKTLTEADKHLLDEIDSKRQADVAAALRKKGPSKTSLSRIMEQFSRGPCVQEFEVPFGKNEHYNLPVNEDLPIIVRDDDAGSMIAFTLASHEYDYQLKLLGHPELSRSMSGTGPALVPGFGDVTNDASYDSQVSVTTAGATFVKDRPNESSNDGSIEVSFEDTSMKFSATVYFAEKFRKLRSSVIKLDVDTSTPTKSASISIEEMFIRSLSTAFEWKAVGGKSGSRFRKTLDDRFIIKEMNNQEVTSFKVLAKKYFDYIEEVVNEGRSTALAKVLGVYKVTYKTTSSSTSVKMYVLVIENLFYNRNITQKFDLKGSGRNRLVDQKKVSKGGQPDEVVLLDTNLVQLIRDSPLYVRPEEKRALQGAIDNDTTFLSSLELIDYSLLVGIHDDPVTGGRGQLVVGIIDYIRSYTWDKKIESAVKSSISGKEPPTIVKPELYKERFLNRMNQYFLPIPDSESKVDLLESCSTVIVL